MQEQEAEVREALSLSSLGVPTEDIWRKDSHSAEPKLKTRVII